VNRLAAVYRLTKRRTSATIKPTNTMSSSASSKSKIQGPIDVGNGRHQYMVQCAKFEVPTTYQLIKQLGYGAYGVVCSALDTSNNKNVAIKKVPKMFQDLTDTKRILREIKRMQHFKHENVVELFDLMGPLESDTFDELYIVMELVGTDLSKLIRSSSEITDQHIQFFIYQALNGLHYIHSAHVIHRDLKPSNLLINSNSELKICDFGLARGLHEDEKQAIELTEYVVTRWYRAPELLCYCKNYDYEIDVWALGCILAELHGRKPLFPGDDYKQQMDLIFTKLGIPSDEDLKFVTNAHALNYIKTLPKHERIPFSQLYPNANPLALDLLEKMLQINPASRIRVDQALAHPYFKKFYKPDKIVSCPKPFDFSFEGSRKMDNDVLMELIWDELLRFRPNMTSQRDKFRKKKH